MNYGFRCVAVVACGLLATAATACPFCTAVKPTLTQQREEAAAAFVGEALDKPTAKRPATQLFKLHRALRGKSLLGAGPLTLAPDVPVKQGSLVLMLGNGAPDAPLKDLQWTAIPLDEAAYAYVVQAPDLRQPAPSGWPISAAFSNIPTGSSRRTPIWNSAMPRTIKRPRPPGTCR